MIDKTNFIAAANMAHGMSQEALASLRDVIACGEEDMRIPFVIDTLRTAASLLAVLYNGTGEK